MWTPREDPCAPPGYFFHIDLEGVFNQKHIPILEDLSKLKLSKHQSGQCFPAVLKISSCTIGRGPLLDIYQKLTKQSKNITLRYLI